MTGTDIWILIAIIVLLLVLVVLAAAETALNRISRVKAQALAEATGTKPAQALSRLVSHPERFINPLLVTVTVLQTGQAFLTSILADRLFGTTGLIVAFVRQRGRVLRARRIDAQDVGGAAHGAGRARHVAVRASGSCRFLRCASSAAR